MKNLAFQISPNLRIEGNKVISYSTVVARIKGNKLLVKGKYSRTTSKHIASVLHIMCLQLETLSEEKQVFYWYESGVKCNSNIKAVSPAVSTRILHGIARGKSVIESLVGVEKVPRKDWSLIKKHFNLPDDCEPPGKNPSIKWESITRL